METFALQESPSEYKPLSSFQLAQINVFTPCAHRKENKSCGRSHIHIRTSGSRLPFGPKKRCLIWTKAWVFNILPLSLFVLFWSLPLRSGAAPDTLGDQNVRVVWSTRKTMCNSDPHRIDMGPLLVCLYGICKWARFIFTVGASHQGSFDFQQINLTPTVFPFVKLCRSITFRRVHYGNTSPQNRNWVLVKNISRTGMLSWVVLLPKSSS